MNHNKERAISLLLVSLDDAAVVKDELPGYLGKFGVDFESFYKSVEKEKLVSEFYSSWDGNIPLNLLFARDGSLIEVMGLTSAEEIEMMINQYEKTKSK